MGDIAPVLRLVPTGSIRFHEHPEHRRTLKLVDRLRADRFLKNPPIVTELRRDRDAGRGVPAREPALAAGHEVVKPGRSAAYLLLDGANRVSAFRELEYSHVPVQVVDYADDAIQLRRWQHLLLEGRPLDLRSIYASFEGVRMDPVPRPEVFQLLEMREIFAALVDENADCWGLFPDPLEVGFQLRSAILVLEQVVAAYEGRTQLERIKLADHTKLPDVIESREHQLVLFPVFTKPELLHLAGEGVLIPTGISRHVIPGRALALNLDLTFLTDLTEETDKLRHFDAYLDRLQLEGRIRFYQESVFMLNE